MIGEDLWIFRELSQQCMAAPRGSKSLRSYRLSFMLGPAQQPSHFQVFAVEVEGSFLPPPLSASLAVNPRQLLRHRLDLE